MPLDDPRSAIFQPSSEPIPVDQRIHFIPGATEHGHGDTPQVQVLLDFRQHLATVFERQVEVESVPGDRGGLAWPRSTSANR